MRYIAAAYLKKGMKLACNVYTGESKILYDKGTVLKPAYVDKINNLGYAGLYVEEDETKHIEIEQMVPEENYMASVVAAREFLETAQNGYDKRAKSESLDKQRNLVMPLIDILEERRRRMVDYIDLKPYNGYDYYHAASVMILSLLVGMELKLEKNLLYELGVAALLHDIGNAFLPPEILNRPGALSDEEFEIVKKHVEKGYDYLHEYHNLSTEACLGALQHHENYDGTGYPNKLKRKQISLFGRIIACTDVYDALVSRRPFRPAKYAQQALEILEQNADRKFDPDIVAAIEKVVAPYPTGVGVQLTTGEKCLVFRNYPDSLSRPRLLPIDGASGVFIDLAKDPELSKVKVKKILE